MKLKAIGNICKIVKKGSQIIKDNGPAVATIVSGICWTGAVVTAIIDAPKAHKAVKDKLEKDPDASMLELAAVGIRPLVKTAAFAAGGAGAQLVSIKITSELVTGMGVTIASLAKDNNRLTNTVKEVVGDEQFEEIKKKYGKTKVDDEEDLEYADELFEVDESLINDIPGYGSTETRPIQFGLTGQVFESSPAEIRENMEKAIQQLVSEDEISVYDIAEWIGANKSVGSIGNTAVSSQMLSNKLYYCLGSGIERNGSNPMTVAREQLEFELVPWRNRYGVVGWSMEFTYKPDTYVKGWR